MNVQRFVELGVMAAHAALNGDDAALRAALDARAAILAVFIEAPAELEGTDFVDHGLLQLQCAAAQTHDDIKSTRRARKVRERL